MGMVSHMFSHLIKARMVRPILHSSISNLAPSMETLTMVRINTGNQCRVNHITIKQQEGPNKLMCRQFNLLPKLQVSLILRFSLKHRTYKMIQRMIRTHKDGVSLWVNKKSISSDRHTCHGPLNLRHLNYRIFQQKTLVNL